MLRTTHPQWSRGLRGAAAEYAPASVLIMGVRWMGATQDDESEDDFVELVSEHTPQCQCAGDLSSAFAAGAPGTSPIGVADSTSP